jgi:two-component sensor histidine kinase
MTAGVETAAKTVVPPESQASASPKPRRRWEAADTVIAASIGLVAVIVGIFVLLCIQGYYTTIEGTKTRGSTAASIVAEGTNWIFASGFTKLDGIARAIGNDPANAGAPTLAMFESATERTPSAVSLGVYDATGNVVAAASSPGAPATIGDKDYFAAVRGGAEHALSAQEKDAATGEPTFALTRRLELNGAFMGAALVMFDGDVMRRLAEPQQMPQGSTMSIIRDDGWVIARYPPLPEPLYLGDTPNYALLTSAESGSYTSAGSPADGVPRMVSFVHIPDPGYYALAAISLPTALGGLWYSIIVVSLLMAPIAIALLIGSFITARLLRRSQQQSRSLAAALEHNEILFREIHHRVKNNLQSINSLIQLQQIPRDVKLDMSQRVSAMAAVHEHIYRSNNFATVFVKGYLHSLVENIRAGYGPQVEVVEEITDVAVDKDAATPLGLVVSEVVANAFKHAFADGRAGKVRVSLAAGDDGTARLTVSDNGVGFDPEAPTRGIGRRLISGLVAQLRGEMSHVSDATGSTFTLTFPLKWQ